MTKFKITAIAENKNNEALENSIDEEVQEKLEEVKSIISLSDEEVANKDYESALIDYENSLILLEELVQEEGLTVAYKEENNLKK